MEIKFRGKEIKSDRWVYGYYYHDIDKKNNKYDNHCIIGSYKDNDEFYIRDIVPKTKGQYVGLKDKNKVEIYEGDIVRVSEEYGGSSYIPLVVDFKDGCFVLRPINNIVAYNPIFEYDFTQIYEVIGNKYDNPELMEF